MEDGSNTTRNRVHLHLATPTNTPDGWTKNDLDAVDPDLGIPIMSAPIPKKKAHLKCHDHQLLSRQHSDKG